MGLDFTKTPEVSTKTPVADTHNEIEVVKQYDITKDREQMTETLVNSPEVDAIVSTIEIYNLDSIVSFGADVAEEISKASDVVLRSMDMSQIEDSGELLQTLAG